MKKEETTPTHPGMVLVNKPRGLTSFRVLGWYKRFFGTTKIGHTGTLDRFAEGLMLVLVGSATRLNQFMVLNDKEYEAEFTFGAETDTLDPEGEVVRTAGLPTREAVEEALVGLRGSLLQVPPVYSAIHVEGKRAYERALAGESPDLAPRAVEVSRFSLLDWTPPTARFHIDCSKGTYVRSLARDLGVAVGSAAYVSALKRTRVGCYTLEGSHRPPQEGEAPGEDPILLDTPALLAAMPGMVPYTLGPGELEAVSHGKPLSPAVTGDFAALLGPSGRLAAIMHREGRRWVYDCVFPQP